jgi:hypothetical protein
MVTEELLWLTSLETVACVCDCPDSEIDIERLHLRVQAASLFPEKIPLYDMFYESRFRRLREQFRCSSDR